jgi:hypothetical protein
MGEPGAIREPILAGRFGEHLLMFAQYSDKTAP